MICELIIIIIRHHIILESKLLILISNLYIDMLKELFMCDYNDVEL